MAKLTGAKKKAFLERMARGRRKAARGNPKRKAPKKKNAGRKPAKKKVGKKKTTGRKKLTGAKKAAFLKRMAAGRRKAGKNPNVRKRKKLFKKAFGRGVTREHMASQKKAAKARRHIRRRGRNPDDLKSAAAMYETFHQRAPGHILEFEQGYQYPQNYAEMGKLKELRFFLDKANPDFPLTSFGECLAVCTPDGNNIYFVGGDQSIDFAALGFSSDKDFVELGPCGYIVYDTTKGFHDFRRTNYWHRFGEEDGIFPRLGYDRLNRTLFLLGGNYRVKREGIVN